MKTGCNDERYDVLNPSVKVIDITMIKKKPEVLKINQRYVDYCSLLFTTLFNSMFFLQILDVNKEYFFPSLIKPFYKFYFLSTFEGYILSNDMNHLAFFNNTPMCTSVFQQKENNTNFTNRQYSKSHYMGKGRTRILKFMQV